MTDEALRPLPHTTQDSAPLSDVQLQVLLNEIARLQEMYLDARNSTQSVFNFYLTFFTAALGGVFFVAQSDAFTRLGQLLIFCGVLLFVGLVGSVYLGAIAARYAHAERFARALDILRLHLFTVSAAPLPSVYERFQTGDYPQRETDPWYAWFFPTGTYQFFMAFISSSSLGLMVGIFVSIGQLPLANQIQAGLLVFLLTLTIYNIYVRLVQRRFTDVLDVRIDSGHALSLWSASQ
ncbi:MAG: hypothetical protein KC496_08475 [Anaerolineae bacterium]|nr:hypothetical protein [Anaerolineae bacterium]